MKRQSMVSVLVVVVLLIAAAPVSAAVRITRIHFDPPGNDARASLNEEYVIIKNLGEKLKRITGWRVHDAGRDHTYVFGSTRLESKECVVLRTGPGPDGRSLGGIPGCVGQRDRHWDLDNYVWNNDGDKATLKNRDRDVIDTCAYSASADSPKAC